MSYCSYSLLCIQRDDNYIYDRAARYAWMYFVNWQRDVTFEERDGRKVVVKRNKSTKEFHEFLISFVYTLISLILLRPSPPAFSEIMANEGQAMRTDLASKGIPTPGLVAIGEEYLIEEFVEGGDLYRSLARSTSTALAYRAGILTGRCHQAGYAFIDNKVQNYLVRGEEVVRTDLAFTQRTISPFARSMDIASFLASVMDLRGYPEVEGAFFDGYLSETGHKFSYGAIIVRNLLSLGFSANSSTMLRNMMLDSRPLVEA